jgi:lipopolysaccharide export system protein LptA
MIHTISHHKTKFDSIGNERDFFLKIMRRSLGTLKVMVYLLILLQCGAAMAQSPAENDKRSQSPVEITADELISHGNENYAEFIGNVAAIQGNFSIHSDALRIYYHTSGTNITADSNTPDALEKIVAIGNVIIKADSRRAETERAEYSLKEDKVVLSGENSTVTDGKNTLTGSKITWHRNTGQISVEGTKQKRVKAVFYSTEGLSLPTQDVPATSESSPTN